MRINDDLSVSFNSEGKRALFWNNKQFAVITDDSLFEEASLDCFDSGLNSERIRRLIAELKMASDNLSDLDCCIENATDILEKL